jgi:hypothetical protein
MCKPQPAANRRPALPKPKRLMYQGFPPETVFLQSRQSERGQCDDESKKLAMSASTTHTRPRLTSVRMTSSA